MTQPTRNPRGGSGLAPWIIALVCLAGIFYVGAGLRGLETSVQTLIQQETNVPTELKSEWRSNGIRTTVTTHKREGESDAGFAARHKATVDATLALFPKDPD